MYDELKQKMIITKMVARKRMPLYAW